LGADSATKKPLQVGIHEGSDFLSGSPNQEIGRTFLFKGLIIGTSSYFVTDSAIVVDVYNPPPSIHGNNQAAQFPSSIYRPHFVLLAIEQVQAFVPSEAEP
jgi:hypothetical protein